MENTELREAWDFIEHTGANLFLTGKAGTGKTTFLKNLYDNSFKRMIVLAPTGIAAINAGGVTLHSFFQLPLSPYIPGIGIDPEGNRKYKFSNIKRSIIRSLDLLVIDEISMVRADLLDAVDSVMRRFRDHNKPFGGVQLLMIGDLQQLSPVIKEDEWTLLRSVYETPYFFSSKALNAVGYHTIELKNVFRQQDNTFLKLLNQIRENKADKTTLDALNKRYIPGFKPNKESDYIRLTTHNLPAKQINERELSLLPTPKYMFKAEVEGDFPVTSYPADETLTLKQGAQVMFIKNDPEHRYFNGMIGEVVNLDNETILVKGKDGGEPFEVNQVEWTNSKYTIDKTTNEIKETVEGVFKQYPLRLAWAITIHKSQGLTFEHAIIDASNSFAHGQTYVALSRCKTLEGLVLSAPLTRDAIISDSELDGYLHQISQLEPSKETMQLLIKKHQLQLLDEMFDFTTLSENFASLLRTIDEYFYSRYPKLLDAYKKSEILFSELKVISANFQKQYVRLLDTISDLSDITIQDRITKASAYFYERLKPFFDLATKTDVTSDNKIAKKQFENRFSDFNDLLRLKTELYKHFKDSQNVFDVKSYLYLKAQLIVSSDNMNETSSRKRTIKRKGIEPKQKISTKEITFEMFSKGMDVAHIAVERGLSPFTIYNHLASCIAEGKLKVSDVVSLDCIYQVKSYLAQHSESTSLNVIKAAVNNKFSYDEIRIVLKSLSKDRTSENLT